MFSLTSNYSASVVSIPIFKTLYNILFRDHHQLFRHILFIPFRNPKWVMRYFPQKAVKISAFLWWMLGSQNTLSLSVVSHCNLINVRVSDFAWAGNKVLSAAQLHQGSYWKSPNYLVYLLRACEIYSGNKWIS